MSDRQLTAKQEKFILAVVEGMTQADAYRHAYNASNMTDKTIIEKASKLAKKHKEHIIKLKRQLAKEQKEMFKDRTIVLRNDVYELLTERIEEYEDLSEVVNQLIIKTIPREAGSVDKWLQLNRRQNISDSVRYEVFFNANFRCQACGDSPSKNEDCILEVDHVIPFSIGGVDHISNYQCLCKKCNISKSNKYAIDHRD